MKRPIAFNDRKPHTMKTQRRQNPIAVAERKLHQNTQTTHRDRRNRRAKDARKSWKREWQ